MPRILTKYVNGLNTPPSKGGFRAVTEYNPDNVISKHKERKKRAYCLIFALEQSAAGTLVAASGI